MVVVVVMVVEKEEEEEEEEVVMVVVDGGGDGSGGGGHGKLPVRVSAYFLYNLRTGISSVVRSTPLPLPSTLLPRVQGAARWNAAEENHGLREMIMGYGKL